MFWSPRVISVNRLRRRAQCARRARIGDAESTTRSHSAVNSGREIFRLFAPNACRAGRYLCSRELAVHGGYPLGTAMTPRNTPKRGNGNGRKQRIWRIAPCSGKLHSQRAVISLRTASGSMSGPRLFPINKVVAIGIVPSSKRSARSVVSGRFRFPFVWMLGQAVSIAPEHLRGVEPGCSLRRKARRREQRQRQHDDRNRAQAHVAGMRAQK